MRESRLVTGGGRDAKRAYGRWDARSLDRGLILAPADEARA